MVTRLPSDDDPPPDNSQDPLLPSQQPQEKEEVVLVVERGEERSLEAMIGMHDELEKIRVGKDSQVTHDFGGLHRSSPAAQFLPRNADDVRSCTHLALSIETLSLTPRGNGHSANGQSLAGPSGVSLDLSRLSDVTNDQQTCSVWAGAGALWEDVLHHCLKFTDCAPRSWTDYLRLSVGGTLSCGGISGQCFLHGPMACNVDELELVTGKGELLRCSPSLNSDLFHAALGGLGQFGVITRARIPLFPAPHMVRCVRVIYASFEDYAKDAESLVQRPESAESFDYVEGFAFVNDPSQMARILPHQTFDLTKPPAGFDRILYCLEVALHYSRGDADRAKKRVENMMMGLRHVRGLEFADDVSYGEFLKRVNEGEAKAREDGTWYTPHPWMNLLVSSEDIVDFDRRVFKGILKDGIGGHMLVYPLLKSKWNPETSLVVPNADVFYLVALLRFSRGDRVEDLMAQNAEILNCCRMNGYDYKVYLPSYTDEAQWKAHFGKKWDRFEERKARYDPNGIMCPQQGMFYRKAHGPI